MEAKIGIYVPIGEATEPFDDGIMGQTFTIPRVNNGAIPFPHITVGSRRRRLKIAFLFQFVAHDIRHGDDSIRFFGFSCADDVAGRLQRCMDRNRSGFKIHIRQPQGGDLTQAHAAAYRQQHRRDITGIIFLRAATVDQIDRLRFRQARNARFARLRARTAIQRIGRYVFPANRGIQNIVEHIEIVLHGARRQRLRR